MAQTSRHVLFIEPYYGGSHKQLVDILVGEFGGVLFTLPPTKWHWRTRVSALHFAEAIPEAHEECKTLFASSVLNLCELVALRPDLGKLYKVLYFHENQLIYPVRKQLERDFQYGYNQILSCLLADVILFNSHFNMTSFLGSISTFLKLIPDHRPKGIVERIKEKCSVLYFPLEPTLHNPFTELAKKALTDTCTTAGGDLQTEDPQSSSIDDDLQSGTTGTIQPNTTDGLNSSTPEVPQQPMCHRAMQCLHIVWPHRWEHDKGPDEFCAVLTKLLDAHLDFVVSILGSHTNDIPASIQAIIPLLGSRLLHKGSVPQEDYWRILKEADVVVSTAKHEFFGVAMLEASYCGCYPLCPNRLVYPEIYPKECLYNTEQQLFKRLRAFCLRPALTKANLQIQFDQFQWRSLKSQYKEALHV